MKNQVLLFSFLIALVLSQTPNPIPTTMNAKVLNGTWWMVASYNGLPPENSTLPGCEQVNIQFKNGEATMVVSVQQEGMNFNSTVVVPNGENNSTWVFNGETWVWLGIHTNYAVFASAVGQSVIFLSSSQILETTNLESVFSSLQKQGYNVNAEMISWINNYACNVSPPSPIPLKKLNLSMVEGEWWIAGVYNPHLPPQITKVMKCFTVDITPDGKNVNYTTNAVVNGESKSNTEIGTMNGSIWNMNGQSYAWLGYDSADHQWALLGNMNAQTLIFLSAQPSLNSKTLQKEIAAAQQQGYQVNAQNVEIFENANCTNISI